MLRIFKYGGIQNTNLTFDKELNILIYWTPSFVIIYENYTLLNMVQFFGPPCVHKYQFYIHVLDYSMYSVKAYLAFIHCSIEAHAGH